MVRAIKKLEISKYKLPKRKRVAAYTRVTSGKAAALHSLSAQISYYSEMIQKNPEWEYAGVYVDEAITGTKESRAEFQRLITDCKAGKIDMIIVKSISRFARNTVTMLEVVRELKNLGIDVYFENENIHSMSGDGELMLTILSSFAQEESFSVSENCKWLIRDKFKQGIPTSCTILGYKIVNEKFEVIPEEAKIVRMIFSDYLSGMGRNAIMKKLIKLKVPTKLGGTWRESVIDKILRNEKYTGDLLFQKSYVADHIIKKKCKNEGQFPMYLIENDHEAIIDKGTFKKVQDEIKKRAKRVKKSKVVYPFTGKIICEQCGKHYRRKITAAGTKYEKPVWICTTFNSYGKKACPSQQIPEDMLLQLVPKDFKEIRVPCHNKIIVVFEDGTSLEKTWQHKPRSESWTAEMRKQAAERSRAS